MNTVNWVVILGDASAHKNALRLAPSQAKPRTSAISNAILRVDAKLPKMTTQFTLHPSSPQSPHEKNPH